jgi:hypothetical protein
MPEHCAVVGAGHDRPAGYNIAITAVKEMLLYLIISATQGKVCFGPVMTGPYNGFRSIVW